MSRKVALKKKCKNHKQEIYNLNDVAKRKAQAAKV